MYARDVFATINSFRASFFAADTDQDLMGAALGGLTDQVRVRDFGAGHADQVGILPCQDLLRLSRFADPTGMQDRQVHHRFERRGQRNQFGHADRSCGRCA